MAWDRVSVQRVTRSTLPTLVGFGAPVSCILCEATKDRRLSWRSLRLSNLDLPLPVFP